MEGGCCVGVWVVGAAWGGCVSAEGLAVVFGGGNGAGPGVDAGSPLSWRTGARVWICELGGVG